MTAVRAAAVAGSFYPGDRTTLRSAVREHLEAVSPRHREGRLIKAIIAPHAGYLYSGPIAGSAFRLLEAERDCIERVILLGPPHRFPVSGLALPGVDGFEVIERLQQDERHRDIPVIVLTAKSLTHEDSSRLRQGVVRIMQKHELEIDTLVAELRSALQRYGGSQTER